MRKVQREELLDYVTYDEQRAVLRVGAMAHKERRRVHLGEHLTFLFENADTVRYQIQEMMRAERLVKEAEIAHELFTYTELLGANGELGCTLLVEIPDEKKRDEFLRVWRELPAHVYLRLEGGEKTYARYDKRQIGDDRLSSVQYLKFATGGRAPVAVGSDLSGLVVEATFTDEQRRTLAADLGCVECE